jgi:hypothetical protein
VEYMLLFVQRRGEPAEAGAMKSMNAFAQELADRGKLRRGAPLAAEAQSIRVRVRDGAVLVHDGPFMETKEVVGGFWVVDVADRSEALEIAKRTPHARYGTVIVQRLSTRFAFPDAGKGTPWFFAFHGEPVVEDCDGAKLRSSSTGPSPRRRRRSAATRSSARTASKRRSRSRSATRTRAGARSRRARSSSSTA